MQFLICVGSGHLNLVIEAKIRLVMETEPLNIGGCPQSQSQILDSGPVADVMSAFITWFGVIRDLVPLEALFMEHGFRLIIHFPLGVLVRKQLRMVVVSLEKWRPLLDDQTVGRNVLWPQHQHLPQRGSPGFQGLSWQCLHQLPNF